MKKIILTVMIITIIGFFSGLIPECFAAGGQPSPGDNCCVVINPGNGALALKGTISLEYTYWVVADAYPDKDVDDCLGENDPYDCCDGGGTGTCDDPVFKSNLDVLLRLSKGQGGDPEFFRLNLLDEDFRLLTDQSILCLILNPWETLIEENRTSVAEFVNQVLKAYYGDDTELNAENTRLVITSISFQTAKGFLLATIRPSRTVIQNYVRSQVAIRHAF